MIWILAKRKWGVKGIFRQTVLSYDFLNCIKAAKRSIVEKEVQLVDLRINVLLQ